VPTVRWGLKGLRRTTGSSSMEAIPQMNRSAQDGEWSSLHDGGEGVWFLPIAPWCVRATRWGRGAGDPGRPGIVQAGGMVEKGVSDLLIWYPLLEDQCYQLCMGVL
jgi:hypothetical protein